MLLSSKKFQATIAAVAVALLAKVGIDADNETILLIISPLVAYILGQGIADTGKERAKIIVKAMDADDANDAAIDSANEELNP